MLFLARILYCSLTIWRWLVTDQVSITFQFLEPWHSEPWVHVHSVTLACYVGVPVRGLAALLLIQLYANVSGKAEENDQNVCPLSLTWKTWMSF